MSVANVPGPNPQRGWSRIGDEKTSTLYRKGLLGQEVSANLKDARVCKELIAFPNIEG